MSLITIPYSCNDIRMT